MPIATRLDSDNGLRVHLVTGRLACAEVRDTLAELYGRADYDPAMNAIRDLREAVTTGMSVDDVRSIAGLVEQCRPGGLSSRVALVVSPEADFGMARMYEAQLGDAAANALRVFRDFDEAAAWVGEDPGHET